MLAPPLDVRGNERVQLLDVFMESPSGEGIGLRCPDLGSGVKNRTNVGWFTISRLIQM
jgi:hypothetical protein